MALGIKCWRVDYDNKTKGYDGFEDGQAFFWTEKEANDAIVEYLRVDAEESYGYYEYRAVEVEI